ncbi:DUF397 domain-containing protein [Streptomyces albidoflavus]|uniref:DUF397 domain-containing protein n=1 Tax=Streptomyces albidoflavus TaxID=1886 RepID=UPI000BAE38E7|nr:DUF397 domain-containing protein [Streptomyces albidoflavus]PAX84485.1 DUF397 domain-containing protein [Streptomyces albidoflavus]PAX91404.1 DUF397 domain-containing protein [Streptomyces albidoflavus]PBO18337.1 DUF397 domain-containing protein [Streptomyces albidoflavus]PBO22245.1 DUF397 domain-containing protein [Streptomyces albidoflavus]PBO22255.1 DUF397 domain-containing protein [Streptomyces albidoflavus]
MTSELPRWVKSSYSGNGGQCVEVATNLVASDGLVPVRDSKDPAGPALGFPAVAFASFVGGVKDGAFRAV